MAEREEDTRRRIPSVGEVLEAESVRPLIEKHGHGVVAGWVRDAVSDLREKTRVNGRVGDRGSELVRLMEKISERGERARKEGLRRVVNATGVILHTGLGRGALSQGAREMMERAAGGCNVEIDLESGERRTRGYQLAEMLRQLTGAEESLIVNNNAAATVLTLAALCGGREVVISRGELIEIGGSFRLPEVFAVSQARLREVGTTNRTRLSDYEGAIDVETAAILKVHPSNYRVVGFAERPTTKELRKVASERGVLLIDDIGSGSLLETRELGLGEEPSFAESVAAGADVVLGSGDKLLGGPQCGVIVGKKEHVDKIRHHPLARAVRVDKLTIAAMEGTLGSYLRGKAREEIPVWQRLTATMHELRQRGESLRGRLEQVEGDLPMEVRESRSAAGGGSLPGVELPTVVLAVRPSDGDADGLARRMRTGRIAVMPRIERGEVLVDLRSVGKEEDELVLEAIAEIKRGARQLR